jgi:protease IV
MIPGETAKPKTDRTFKFLLVGLGLFFVFTLVFMAYAFQRMLGDSAPQILPFQGEVTLIDIIGPIYESDGIVKRISRFRKSSTKALLLRLDSPGGGVAASQEIYTELLRARKEDKKIIVASIASVGASGAYYIASACDRIICNPGSITGSIGVIAEFPDASGILGKIGFKFQTIKSGKFKDTGAIDRPLTPDERAYLQETIDDVYGQFLDAVVKGRRPAFQEKLAARMGKKANLVTDAEILAHIRRFADGRILTGRKAFDEGFVDQLGNYYDAVKLIGNLAGIKGEPSVHRDQPVRMDKVLNGLLPFDLLHKAKSGWRLQYLAY